MPPSVSHHYILQNLTIVFKNMVYWFFNEH